MKRQLDNLLSPEEVYARVQELARMLAWEWVVNRCGVLLGKQVKLVQVVGGDNKWHEGLYQDLIEVLDDEVEEMDVEELLKVIDDDS